MDHIVYGVEVKPFEFQLVFVFLVLHRLLRQSQLLGAELGLVFFLLGLARVTYLANVSAALAN